MVGMRPNTGGTFTGSNALMHIQNKNTSKY